MLGTAFAAHGDCQAAAALLGLGGVSWALLVRLRFWRHWQTPATGVSFVLTVATQGLAVLGATLAARDDAACLLHRRLSPR